MHMHSFNLLMKLQIHIPNFLVGFPDQCSILFIITQCSQSKCNFFSMYLLGYCVMSKDAILYRESVCDSVCVCVQRGRRSRREGGRVDSLN